MDKSVKPKVSKRFMFLSVLAVLGMFAFGFAMVPLYDVFCDITGLNGKTSDETALASQHVDKSREVTLLFLSTKNENLPWQFHANVTKVNVHPGENKRIAYFARNDTDKAMTVQAIPSVSPGIAAKYLRKTECFCFNQQTLNGGESIDMPVLFHVDASLPKDIHTITLSYTLFDAGKFKRTETNTNNRFTLKR